MESHNLSRNSASLLLLPSSLLSLPRLLSQFQWNIYSLYKYRYTVKTDLFIRRWNMYTHLSLRSSAPLTEKVTKFNMNINLNLIEQG